jgi:hypothetical protein
MIRKTGPKVWAYGVTTCRKRRDNHLPLTLDALRDAGFDKPRLFADGTDDACGWEAEFDLPVTVRGVEPVGTFRNWLMAVTELYVRSPGADRYAIFEDDLDTRPGLREYLDAVPWPDGKAYVNLYTAPTTEDWFLSKSRATHVNLPGGKQYELKAPVPHVAPDYRGFLPTRQDGKGAVALVFDWQGVRALLAGLTMWERAAINVRTTDGAIAVAMAAAGYTEHAHLPCLVKHVGLESVSGHVTYPPSRTYDDRADYLSWVNSRVREPAEVT